MPAPVRTYDELVKLITKTYSNPDLHLIQEAFKLANSAHSGEARASGEPFVTHPLAVAYKLADMGMHLNMVAAGLLHDVVEDTGITIEQVRTKFGDDVASLVDSVTKLKQVKYRGVERYVENLRKMFLAMASDVRVVFIKFADRLHNMQTLQAKPKYKQDRTARETLEIYAPIAGRLGMNEMRGELEDLAFSFLQQNDYERVHQMAEVRIREKGALVSRLIEINQKLLQQSGIPNSESHGRVKRIYSLYKKLQRYNDDISKIYDFIAIRIIVQDVEECYAALGLLHKHWRPIPGRIKDFIAQPKPNGYQSLHTTVFCEKGEIVEFQIRTQEMHDIAEYGIAAHWRYKDPSVSTIKNLKWMEELGSLQKELANKKEFMQQLEMMKIDIFKDRLFVFTPKGDVIDLPDGATPIDFAYAIHTEIGNKCSGAIINDIKRSLNTELTSGDVIQIIIDKNRKGPNPDWLKFAKTRHARIKIRESTKRSVKVWFSDVMSGRNQAKK
ncbi:MAG: RelA/SpoT family protein [Patescibacteria group bacterium]